MYELIYLESQSEYNDLRTLLQKTYPNAQVENASDEIHEYRLSIEVAGVDEDTFYMFALREGFVLCCLGFQCIMQEDIDRARRIIAEYKAGKE